MKKLQALLLLLSFQFSCTSERKIEAYNIKPMLAEKAKLAVSNEDKVKLELCNQIPFKWDKIIVIPPYSNAQMISKYELDNSKFIEDNMIDSLYDEGKCLLLYIEKNTIQRYSFVPRTPLDFNYINNSDTIKTLSRKLICDELYIKVINGTTKLWQ